MLDRYFCIEARLAQVLPGLEPKTPHLEAINPLARGHRTALVSDVPLDYLLAGSWY